MMRAVLTDAMDVLFWGFTGQIQFLHEVSGASKSQLSARNLETLDDLWSACRNNMSEDDRWERFVAGVDWTDDEGNPVYPESKKLLMAFRDNMRKSIDGTFEIYQKLSEQYGLTFYLASDHVAEIVPQLIEWHPEVFKLIPERRRFWSCDLKLVKQDSEFFPHVLTVMEKDSGIKCDEILFIDDSEGNIEMARKNRIEAICFTSAQQLVEDLKAYGFEI